MSKIKFRALDENTAEIYLYGIIFMGTTAQEYAEQLNEISKQYNKVNVRINCPGGSVFDGIAIYNINKQSKCEINTYVDGVAASMGSVIAMSGKKIYMSKYARLMTHPPSGSADGDADTLREAADQIDSLGDDLAKIYATRTGLTVDAVKAKFMQKGINKWYTAQDALNEKLCDEIYDGPVVTISAEALKTATAKDLWNFYNQIDINQTKEESMKNLAKFIALFAIANMSIPADASEEVLLTNLQSLVDLNKDATAKLTAAEAKLKAFEDKAKLDNEAKITKLVQDAIDAGKITADLKETYTTMATSNFEAAEKAINAMKVYTPVIGQLKPGEQKAADEKANWSFMDYQKKDPKALEKMKSENIDAFKALFKAQYGSEYKG